MIEPIGERLKKLMVHYHLNMNSLSHKIGLTSNSVITRVVNDPNRGISLDYIQKILLAFREINPEWFILNKGDMFRNKPLSNAELQSGPCDRCREKEERIKDLNERLSEKDQLIKAKDDVIKMKDELLGERRKEPEVGKQAAAG